MLSGGRLGRSAAVALEFAAIVPVMILLALGTYDIESAVATWRRVRAAATAIAEIATSQALQTGTYNTGTSTIQGVITNTAAQASSTAIYAYLTQLRASGTTIPFSVTLSSIKFQPLTVTNNTTCTGATCVCLTTTTAANGTITTSPAAGGTNSANTQCYHGYTAWSTSYGGNNTETDTNVGAPVRPCSTAFIDTPAGSPSSLTTLPMGVFGPYSLIVADISYTWTPTFAKFITGPITFFESAYVPPRSGTAGQYVEYSTATASPYTPTVAGVHPTCVIPAT
jgi:Flp pilus assembly protein TadG